MRSVVLSDLLHAPEPAWAAKNCHVVTVRFRLPHALVSVTGNSLFALCAGTDRVEVPVGLALTVVEMVLTCEIGEGIMDGFNGADLPPSWFAGILPDLQVRITDLRSSLILWVVVHVRCPGQLAARVELILMLGCATNSVSRWTCSRPLWGSLGDDSSHTVSHSSEAE